MRKIITFSSLLILGSCTSLPFLDNAKTSINQSPERSYVDLQVKIHSTYSLFKALNAGIITQEEYDELKQNIFDL